MARKAKVAKDKLSVGHHCGDVIYGYDVLADGRIKLCPSLTDQFRSVLDRENALLEMQQGIAHFVSEQLRHTQADKRKWWAKIKGELGDARWAFDGNFLFQRPEPEEALAEQVQA